MTSSTLALIQGAKKSGGNRVNRVVPTGLDVWFCINFMMESTQLAFQNYVKAKILISIKPKSLISKSECSDQNISHIYPEEKMSIFHNIDSNN